MSSLLKGWIPAWVRKGRREMEFRFRQKSWSDRALPSFIIIGAQKAGTTSLFNYLGQHPDIFPSFTKEVHFFDGGMKPEVDTFALGESWYRAHFPAVGELGDHRVAFEASPLYIFNPLVPGRIADLVPQVKLIAVLRDPVDRAISHYFHERRGNREHLTIDEALRAEEDRLAPILRSRDYKNEVFINHSYKARGRYGEQLERFFARFERENILIIDSDELFSRPGDVLRQIFGFVGVDEDFQVRNLKPLNVGSYRGDEEAKVREFLEEYFQPHNEFLYDLIERKLSW